MVKKPTIIAARNTQPYAAHLLYFSETKPKFTELFSSILSISSLPNRQSNSPPANIATLPHKSIQARVDSITKDRLRNLKADWGKLRVGERKALAEALGISQEKFQKLL
jgi:hypothetical protein